MESILDSTKKVLGVDVLDTAFDNDIIFAINTVLGILNQEGIGPEMPLVISDETTTWDELLGDHIELEAVKSFVFMKTKMLFDPPASSTLADAMERQIRELEVRMYTASGGY